MTTTKQQTKGFTIIEVVLVLAIAALIFLMIFIALPALQRGQRDTQRRSDVGTFVSQLSSYATNNSGKVPASADELTTFKNNYLKWKADNTGEFNDPKTGNGYTISYTNVAPTTEGQISYIDKYKCNGETVVADATNTRVAAVMVKLEGAGVFCKDNQQ